MDKKTKALIATSALAGALGMAYLAYTERPSHPIPASRPENVIAYDDGLLRVELNRDATRAYVENTASLGDYAPAWFSRAFGTTETYRLRGSGARTMKDFSPDGLYLDVYTNDNGVFGRADVLRRGANITDEAKLDAKQESVKAQLKSSMNDINDAIVK